MHIISLLILASGCWLPSFALRASDFAKAGTGQVGGQAGCWLTLPGTNYPDNIEALADNCKQIRWKAESAGSRLAAQGVWPMIVSFLCHAP